MCNIAGIKALRKIQEGKEERWGFYFSRTGTGPRPKPGAGLEGLEGSRVKGKRLDRGEEAWTKSLAPSPMGPWAGFEQKGGMI